MGALWARRGLLLRCVDAIPELLQKAGFVNIRLERRDVPLGGWGGQLGEQARDNFIGVWRAQKTPMLKLGGFGIVNSEAEYDQLVSDVEDEWNSNTSSHMEVYVFIAQKPLET